VLNKIILRPDDWHVHFRDSHALKNTVAASEKHFGRVLVMPNLQPPLTNITEILAYRERIMTELKNESSFHPYMTLYLNETIKPEHLSELKTQPDILGAKLYPAGATTNSAQGAKSISALYPHFEALQEANLVLQIHGEVTHGDIFDRESLFIKNHLAKILKNFPRLKVVLEHISTKAAVEFISQAKDNIAATITPHHLLFNRNQMLTSGIKPHYYCLPILKRESDQKALLQAATSGNKKFFAGTDSAPHSKNLKESECGCAGVYSAPYAVAMYAEAFDKLNAIDKLENFIARFGANFYQLPIQSEQIEIIKKPQVIPLMLPLGNDKVVPLAAGRTLQWSVL
jgi:dihydroorotase